MEDEYQEHALDLNYTYPLIEQQSLHQSKRNQNVYPLKNHLRIMIDLMFLEESESLEA